MKRDRWIIVILLITGLSVIVLGFVAAHTASLLSPPPMTTVTPPTFTPPTWPPTATPPTPKELTICQSEEPNTLFLYGSPNRSAYNILQAIYDGPIDIRAYEPQPVILEKLPSLADGDAIERVVEAREGDRVVDINGAVWSLAPGVTVLNAAGEPVVFSGGTITMTQRIVTFTLRQGLTWSDGHPLTADDSLYSFELAGQRIDALPLWRQLLHERTSSYTAADERTVVWTSIPGYKDTFRVYWTELYIPTLYSQLFYPPLPRHAWGAASADFLINSEVAARRPLGWGPFVIEDWVSGDHITLVRNAHYFRAAEGLPHLDRITFRFTPHLDQALDLLMTGECDIITPDVIEGKDPTRLLSVINAGLVQAISSHSNEWELLYFSVESANWYRRPSFFADRQTRQAVAQCIDRERIAREAFPYGGPPTVAHSYVAAEHPLYASDVLQYWHYNPVAGRALLEEAGWRDSNGDGIREALGVSGVAYGTPFSVTLITTSDDPARERTAGILSENLADCGIRLSVRYIADILELISETPDSLLAGRQFDLALFSLYNDGPYASCESYLSSQIPANGNYWGGTNYSGYSSAEYDAACLEALAALPGTDAYIRAHHEAQRIFSQDLPVLPLYFVPQIMVARHGVSGLIMDPSQLYPMWNIEQFDITQNASD